jgi:hypothetical protein
MTAKQYQAALDRLRYDPEAGFFYWRVPTRNKPAGTEAGFLTSSGQIGIKVAGRIFLAHRLAWFFSHGREPSGQIDHINGIPTDNRIVNLRDVSASQNQWNRGKPKNNTSSKKGVSWRARRKRGYASISVRGQSIYLGSFLTLDAAASAYEEACRRHHGEFGRTE